MNTPADRKDRSPPQKRPRVGPTGTPASGNLSTTPLLQQEQGSNGGNQQMGEKFAQLFERYLHTKIRVLPAVDQPETVQLPLPRPHPFVSPHPHPGPPPAMSNLGHPMPSLSNTNAELQNSDPFQFPRGGRRNPFAPRTASSGSGTPQPQRKPGPLNKVGVPPKAALTSGRNKKG